MQSEMQKLQEDIANLPEVWQNGGKMVTKCCHGHPKSIEFRRTSWFDNMESEWRLGCPQYWDRSNLFQFIVSSSGRSLVSKKDSGYRHRSWSNFHQSLAVWPENLWILTCWSLSASFKYRQSRSKDRVARRKRSVWRSLQSKWRRLHSDKIMF